MPREPDIAAVTALSLAFRFAWGRRPLAGEVGERLGDTVGSSTEFHDYRSYVPGDDIRYVDWKAYARSDTLTVRLFREEIAPRVDLLVDESASMGGEEEKAARTQELITLFALLAKRENANLRIINGETAREVRDPFRIEFAPRNRLLPWPRPEALRLRKRSFRILLSDFLFPHDPARLLKTVARGAGRVCLVRLNTPEETNPSFRGPYRLVEIEDGTQLDLRIGPAEIERYRMRLKRLTDDLEREAARAHAGVCSLSTAQDLKETAKTLLRSGILEAS